MADLKAEFYNRENGLYYFEEINEVLNTCKNIDEFDVIPSIKPENISSSFVLDQNKLGIFSWCVKDLFHYVYAEVIRTGKWRFSATENEGFHLMNLSQVLLLLHSEDYTVWNLRKCYVRRQTEEYARAELDFCALVLTKHPRSAETFSHRRWLIKLLRETKTQILETRQFLEDELKLTLLCAERHRDNYITWDQRCWLVDYFMFDKISWLEEELTGIRDWLWSHVSDNCVYHFRQHLLRNLAASCSSMKIKELLLEEFKFTDELLKHYKVFETIWCHRRFLVSFWSTKFGSCSTCIARLYQNNDQLRNNKNRRFNLKDLKEGYKNFCEACQKLDKSEIISVQSEIELCQRIIIETDDKELTREALLAMSHWTWLGYFCKKLLKKTSK